MWLVWLNFVASYWAVQALQGSHAGPCNVAEELCPWSLLCSFQQPISSEDTHNYLSSPDVLWEHLCLQLVISSPVSIKGHPSATLSELKCHFFVESPPQAAPTQTEENCKLYSQPASETKAGIHFTSLPFLFLSLLPINCQLSMLIKSDP